ncbi:hypothetical protein D0809_09455 [Flavobacterium circumlabens]|uniref:Uncharacterized protein n=1 Tax=Flavobacterium circumlabens TaxID=2133765 RepID=A0A4Y7UFZ6_9FLAO|nr:hypothetical protein [Flavobacterium circumlabens]TCN60149.1 hypothetical protein EV142_102769 [Flavobacterium circumlabens]TEB45375.1 hypothetical protein D0809_09455 [Flavobacterium circumlabens]
MAESKNNIITHGLSGKVGDIIVFSQRGSKTIVSKAPKERTGEPTEKQKKQIAKFQEATIYAKAALQEAATKAIYEKGANPEKNISAYNVAVADMLGAPKIEEIDLSQYKGKKGDTISVKVTDDFKVVAVKVLIENADGTLVEEGNAKISANGLDWIYTATKENDDLTGDKITIQATDLPDNLTEKEQML